MVVIDKMGFFIQFSSDMGNNSISESTLLLAYMYSWQFSRRDRNYLTGVYVELTSSLLISVNATYCIRFILPFLAKIIYTRDLVSSVHLYYTNQVRFHRLSLKGTHAYKTFPFYSFYQYAMPSK